MRRNLGYLLAAGALLAAACSDNQLAPNGSTGPGMVQYQPLQPRLLVVLPTECATPAQAQRAIDELLPQLFVIGGGRWITAIAYNLKIQLARRRGDTALVKSTVEAFINFTLQAYYAGNVTGGQTPESQARVLKLIYLLYCSNNITPIPDLSGIFDAQNTVLVTNASPTTVVSDPLDSAAVKVDQGDVPPTVFGTFISVHRTDQTLPTSLDWYGIDGFKLGAFEFVANPPVAFDQPVLAGVCISYDDATVSANDLRLAHAVEPGDPPAVPGNTILTTAGGTIEIGAYADPSPLGLGCDPLPPPTASRGLLGRLLHEFAQLVVPQPLYGGTTGGSTGGQVRKFSPFAAVDIKLATNSTGPSSPQVIPTGSSQINAPVTLTVQTRNGATPIDGVSVGFAPSASFSPASAFTDGTGTATSSWTLVAGTNTATATPALAPLVFVPATASYSVVALAPVSITSPAALGDGVKGTAYPSTSFTATGGTGSYTWAVVSGALPSGLTLSAAGVLSGIPTAHGTFGFTVQATSGPTSATRAYTLKILVPVSITTTSPLPYAKKGHAYSKTLQATGGTGSYTWSVTGGALPSGFSLSAAGVLSGTTKSYGTFTFTVRVESGPTSATKVLSLTVKRDDDD